MRLRQMRRQAGGGGDTRLGGGRPSVDVGSGTAGGKKGVLSGGGSQRKRNVWWGRGRRGRAQRCRGSLAATAGESFVLAQQQILLPAAAAGWAAGLADGGGY